MSNATYWIDPVHAFSCSLAEEIEAYGFAVVCYREGIPFVKIAVISDSDITHSIFSDATVQISMTNGATLLVEMIKLYGEMVGHCN